MEDSTSGFSPEESPGVAGDWPDRGSKSGVLPGVVENKRMEENLGFGENLMNGTERIEEGRE